MSNDYAKRAGKTTLLSGKNPYTRRKTIKILFFLLCLGLIIFVVIKTKRHRQETQQLKREQKAQITAGKTTAPSKSEQFDFYTILPNLEVSQNNKSPVLALPNKPLETPYIIELASFKEIGEAGKLRQELSSLNFSAKVNSLTLNDDTWFRVYIGPFASVADAKVEQDKLKILSLSDGLIIKNSLNIQGKKETTEPPNKSH